MQVSYAIGVAEPMGVYVDTYGTADIDLNDGEIAARLKDIFDLRPAAIISRLNLKTPIYSETAAYGHMGRPSEKKTISFKINGGTKEVEVETFTWEKLDFVDQVKEVFNL